MAMMPRVLKNFSLIVDGRGYAGRVAELTTPKLTRKMEEYRGGGMAAPAEMDMGMEKLECDFTLKEYSEEVLKLWGVADLAGVAVRFKGALEADDATGTITSVEIVARGRWRELDGGAWKPGEATSLKVTMACSYFKYVVNGATLIEIDVVNMVEIVNGVDRMAAVRTALEG